MARAFGFIVLLCALWAGAEIYARGVGTVSSQPLPPRDRELGSQHPGDSNRAAASGPITQRVRERVSADLEAGFARHGGGDD
jgi:hypothetical protein